MDLTHWLPTIIGVLGGPAGAGVIVAWWKHKERTRTQTDDVALSLVAKLQERVDVLEKWVRDLQHDLRGALAENDGLFWLLKYAPENRRAEAVADVEARRAQKAAARLADQDIDRLREVRGEIRQTEQVRRSAQRIRQDEDGA